MVEIHQTIANIFEGNIDELEAFECEDQFSDTQSFCDHYGFKIEDSCNAILLKSKKPKEFFALFCVLGSNRLDVNHKAKSLLNAKKISFASKEEAESITNQIYGGISPLGLPSEINVFIDKNVMEREKVFIGGGNRVSKFFLKPEILKNLTNGTVEWQLPKIQNCNISKFFDAVVISKEYDMLKPDPKIFHLTCHKLGLENRQCVMVGDNLLTDIDGAQKAGMKAAIHVDTGIVDDRNIQHVHPDFTITKIADLNNTLEKINWC